MYLCVLFFVCLHVFSCHRHMDNKFTTQIAYIFHPSFPRRFFSFLSQISIQIFLKAKPSDQFIPSGLKPTRHRLTSSCMIFCPPAPPTLPSRSLPRRCLFHCLRHELLFDGCKKCEDMKIDHNTHAHTQHTPQHIPRTPLPITPLFLVYRPRVLMS